MGKWWFFYMFDTKPFAKTTLTFYQRDPLKWTSVDFDSKYDNFHRGKCIQRLLRVWSPMYFIQEGPVMQRAFPLYDVTMRSMASPGHSSLCSPHHGLMASCPPPHRVAYFMADPPSTHWDRDKMVAIFQMTFQMHFLEWKYLNFKYK